MKAYRALAEALVAEGVDTAFGLVGGGIGHFVDAAAKSGVRFVPTRHEQGAVGMADGYSRASGRPGVAFLSHGPGVANAATPMVVARKARSRVLVVMSDLGAHERFTPHGFEQELFLRSTIGDFVTVKSALTLHLDLAQIFAKLRRGTGPVALNVPADVFEQDVSEPWTYRPVEDAWSHHRPAPDRAAVERVLELIAEAERPLVIAGRGAILSGARDELIELARRIGAPLAETLMAKGWFGGEPRSLGLTGGFGDPDNQELLRAADLVLAFGATLTRYSTHWGTLYEDAKVVRVDLRPESAPDMTAVEVSLWSDVRATAEALLAELEPAERPSWADTYSPPPPDETPSDVSVSLGLGTQHLPEPTGGADPRLGVQLLDEALPRDRAVVIDAGNHMGVSGAHFTVADPLSQYYPWEFGAIGGGFAVAYGAALARPERPTVAFLGDGSFMLSLADTDVVRREPARLLVVLVEDGGFRSERGAYAALGFDASLADYDNPDLAALAALLGFDAYSAADDDELRAEVERLTATDPEITRPALLRIRVDRFVANPEIDRAFAAYRPY